jgi:hypothetical protein
LNFDGMNQMSHVDLDFNLNADDIQMNVDPVPVALGERFENTPCPDSVSKKKKVGLSSYISAARLTSTLQL